MTQLTTTTATEISPKTWANLLNKMQSDPDSDLTTFVGMTAEYGKYKASFYGDPYSNYWQISPNEGIKAFHLEDFGYMKGNDWVQCEPTPEQRQQMEALLTAEYVRLVDAEYDKQAQDREDEDYHLGVMATQRSIDYNFNRTF